MDGIRERLIQDINFYLNFILNLVITDTIWRGKEKISWQYCAPNDKVTDVSILSRDYLMVFF